MNQNPALIAVLLALPLLAGCDTLMQRTGMSPAPAAAPAPRPTAIPPAAARSAEALDTTTDAERAAALAAPSAAGQAELGRVVVALGAPAEPGFWLRSALVTAERPGRVVTASGASAAVTLLPGSGAAQLSLPAFRALGLSLTDLPEVTVFGG